MAIVEDEKELGETLADFLRAKNFEVRHYLSAEEYSAAHSPARNAIHLIDWNLPGRSGIELVKSIRSQDKISPLFMISGFSQNQQILEGLRAGADDYLTKPFDLEGLAVRVENAWAKLKELEGDLLSAGLRLIPEANSVMKDGVTVGLTAREFTIFQQLHAKPETVSREELMALFDATEKMTVRNIDVHIFFLRKKLKKLGIVIQTVWGAGYRIDNSAES